MAIVLVNPNTYVYKSKCNSYYYDGEVKFSPNNFFDFDDLQLINDIGKCGQCT